jgi:hypothetical protein
VSKHCFGGGAYSTTHSRMLRMVGRGQRQLAEISIKPKGRGIRLPNGVMRANAHPPYMPEKLTDQFHPSGNSLCFQIQLAHLMGCDPIYALGFTLQSGLAYHFGRENPTTKRATLYDSEVPLAWLSWYESQYPGRVRLLPGFDGPVYKVLQTEGFDDVAKRCSLRRDGSEAECAVPGEPNPGQHSERDQAVGQSQRRDGRAATPEGETPSWW